jgi:predicted cupin superfamily sugar epimerase
MRRAEQLIAALQLQPLPLEGGYYRETYRSALQLPASCLGSPHADARSAATAIYYLLTPETCSALHRLPSDEVFHFYLGDPVDMLQLEEDGTGRIITLGPDLLGGQLCQTVVAKGVWQGSLLRAGGDFALLGTTMAPGFDFADYEAGQRAQLLSRYPAFAEWIVRLTG